MYFMYFCMESKEKEVNLHNAMRNFDKTLVCTESKKNNKIKMIPHKRVSKKPISLKTSRQKKNFL